MKGMYAVVKHSGMEPGLEFKVALKEAEKLNAKARRCSDSRRVWP